MKLPLLLTPLAERPMSMCFSHGLCLFSSGVKAVVGLINRLKIQAHVFYCPFGSKKRKHKQLNPNNMKIKSLNLAKVLCFATFIFGLCVSGAAKAETQLSMSNANKGNSSQGIGIEFDITQIASFDERIIFLHELLNDGRFDVINSENDGIFIVTADDSFEDFGVSEVFRDFQLQSSNFFSELDKNEASVLAQTYKADIPDCFVQSLMMDVYMMSRQNNNCAAAEQYCSSYGTYAFPAGVNAGNGELGPNYDCLTSTPNPAWYYLKIVNPGSLDILISSTPSHDLDFCCWGPFDDPVSPCPNGLTTEKVVSCSYSTQATEHCLIPSTAQTDEYYILVVTNYSNQSCNIIFSKAGGDGSCSCGPGPFNISVSAMPEEGGIVSGGGLYDNNSICTVSAEANPGFTFMYWTVNDEVVSNDANYTFNVTDEGDFVAHFGLPFSITATASPTSGGIVTGGGAFDYGMSCTVTAIANPGFTFMYWTVNDEIVSYDVEYTFTVTSERNLVANFGLPFTITTTANPTAGGTVSGGGAFDYGMSCTVVATANPGFTFMYWTVNDEIVSYESNYTFIVTGERNLVANFGLPFTITTTADPEEGGTVAGGGAFDYGMSCTVSAIANPGYTFMYWTVEDEVVSYNANYTFTVTSERTLVAHFALPFTITVTANPATGGTVTGNGAYNYQTSCTITATANTAYTFTNWTKDGVIVSTNPSYHFFVTESANYIANFTLKNYTIYIKANPAEGGVVSFVEGIATPTISPVSGTYYEAQNVNLTCTTEGASIYYSTVSENGPWTAYTHSITVDEDITIWAYATKEGYENSPMVSANYVIRIGQSIIFNQDWEGELNGWTFVDVQGYTSWVVNLHSGNHYAYANGYNQGDSEDWCISPAFNLDAYSGATLSFRTAKNYNGNELEIFFSNDYNGSDPTIATWIALPCALSTSGYNWVESGNIELSDFSGSNCYIGFKYTCTEEDAAAWEVDDILLIGQNLQPDVANNEVSLNNKAHTSVNDYTRISDLNLLFSGCRVIIAARYDDNENAYFAMSNTSSGKPTGVLFTSTANEGNEILPASIVDEEDNYYWIVGVTANGYTFTNANGEQMGYVSSTNFATGGDNIEWTIEQGTAGTGAMIPNYTGFVFRNFNHSLRAISLNTNHNFGLYNTQNINNGNYNFYLDIFMEDGTTPWQTSDFEYGATVTVNAVPNEGYIFVNWMENGEVVSTNPYYCFETTQARSLIANFSPGYNVSVSVNPVQGGIVTGEGAYPAGSTCTLNAIPNPGYSFAYWSIGGVTITTNPTYSFIVNSDRTMTANFVEEGYHFTLDGCWSTASNWLENELPCATDFVFINANCTLDTNAEVAGMTISNDKTLTIVDGMTLTVNGEFDSPSPNTLVIEDGARINTANNVYATVKKNIVGYGESEGGYYLIANPLANSISPVDAGLVTQESSYDLYDWDYSTSDGLEWRNYKQNTFSLYDGWGVLYANESDVELNFDGIIRANNVPVTKTPSYYNGYEFSGWSLYGNPFVCDAYLSTEATGVAFYRMNATGDGFETASGVIHPLEGFFVQTPTSGQPLTISREAPVQRGQLNMNLSRNNKQLDNAIVIFGEGQNLGKMSFRKNSSKVYMPLEGKDCSAVFTIGMGEMPVSFKAECNGIYTLDFSNEEVTFNYLHLIDNLTGNDVDLLQTPTYTFEAKTTDYASRFKLVFVCGDADGDDNFAFFSNGNFVINNEGQATLQVVDVTGRIVKSETINGCANVKVDAATGVYMLRLVNGENVKVQKVVVR